MKGFIHDIEKFDKFHVDVAKTIPGAGTQLKFQNPFCKVQFFPFHMDHNFRFKTPWPTIHLLQRCDLDRVRRGGEDVSTAISRKNEQTLTSIDTKKTLVKIVIDSVQFPDPILLTKAFVPNKRQG